MNNVRIAFVNKTSEPLFTSNSVWTTNFTENDEGKDEIREIPAAFDPKNLDVNNDEDKYKIFYFIDSELNQLKLDAISHSLFIRDLSTRGLPILQAQ